MILLYYCICISLYNYIVQMVPDGFYWLLKDSTAILMDSDGFQWLSWILTGWFLRDSYGFWWCSWTMVESDRFRCDSWWLLPVLMDSDRILMAVASANAGPSKGFSCVDRHIKKPWTARVWDEPSVRTHSQITLLCLKHSLLFGPSSASCAYNKGAHICSRCSMLAQEA